MDTQVFLMKESTPGRFSLQLATSVFHGAGQRFLGAWEQKIDLRVNTTCRQEIENWLPQRETSKDIPACLRKAIQANKSALEKETATALHEKLMAQLRIEQQEYEKRRLFCQGDKQEPLDLAIQQIDDYSPAKIGGMNKKATRFITFNLTGHLDKDVCHLEINGHETTRRLGNRGAETGVLKASLQRSPHPHNGQLTFTDKDGKSIYCKVGTEAMSRLAECNFAARLDRKAPVAPPDERVSPVDSTK